MTRDELLTRLEAIGWNQADLRRAFRIEQSTIHRWAKPKGVPRYAQAFLLALEIMSDLQRLSLKHTLEILQLKENHASDSLSPDQETSVNGDC